MASMSITPINSLTQVFLVLINLVAAGLALTTLYRVFVSRHSLLSETLTEESRRLLWKVVFFVIFPLSNLLKMLGTQSIVRALGGDARVTNFGFYYYTFDLEAALWSQSKTVLAAISGEMVLFAFLAALLPVFLLRPNPLFSTLLGYSLVFLTGYNLTCNQIFSALGLTFGPWSIIDFDTKFGGEDFWVLGLSVSVLSVLMFVAGAKPTRNWFSQLSRPVANQRLQEAVALIRQEKNIADSPALICRLAHLYHLAGLTKESKAHLKMLNRRYKSSIYTAFLNATLAYHLKKFDYAREKFVFMANHPELSGEKKLKADFLAAASCASFAQGKARSAFRLCLKALQADRNCLLAQLIKVDTLLATGKFSRLEMENDSRVLFEVDPQKALDEIVPLDFNKTFDAIARIDGQVSVELAQK